MVELREALAACEADRDAARRECTALADAAAAPAVVGLPAPAHATGDGREAGGVAAAHCAAQMLAARIPCMLP